MRKFIAIALLLVATPAMAGTYIAPAVHVAPVVHVAPMVRVAPVVRVNPVVRTNNVVKPVGQPAAHPHHLRPQPVVLYTAAQNTQKPKCVEKNPGSKECARK
jgi:hypothetical protein